MKCTSLTVRLATNGLPGDYPVHELLAAPRVSVTSGVCCKLADVLIITPPPPRRVVSDVIVPPRIPVIRAALTGHICHETTVPLPEAVLIIFGTIQLLIIMIILKTKLVTTRLKSVAAVAVGVITAKYRGGVAAVPVVVPSIINLMLFQRGRRVMVVRRPLQRPPTRIQ